MNGRTRWLTGGALDALLVKDGRYAREAYFFVQAALDYYQRRHRSGRRAEHVPGADLLSGVRELALAEYGPMAHLVLNHWGLWRGEDVGEGGLADLRGRPGYDDRLHPAPP